VLEIDAEKTTVAVAKQIIKDSDPEKQLLMEDLLERYMEKIPEAARKKVADEIKDDPIADQIKFVKKLAKIGVDVPKPTTPAGQLPTGGQPVKPSRLYEKNDVSKYFK